MKQCPEETVPDPKAGVRRDAAWDLAAAAARAKARAVAKAKARDKDRGRAKAAAWAKAEAWPGTWSGIKTDWPGLTGPNE